MKPMPPPVRRALLSVSDQTGLVELARSLAGRNIEILSTGGTAQLLTQHGVPVREVAAYTGFPEIMDGRVKTLHPKIHGGLLGRRGVDDAVMAQHAIAPIDLLVVNLYPFAAAVAAYLSAQQAPPPQAFPATLSLLFEKVQDLRYGENPHQSAALYRDPAGRGAGVAAAHMLQGKDLSYNNIADADTAVECVRQFAQTACVIVKQDRKSVV